MSADEFTIPPALPSSTVILVRAGETLPQVLMVLRRPGDAFGNNYTFPGGVLDDDESEAGCHCAGRTAENANAVLNLTTGGLDYYCAAVRELFEETGVLLARDADGEWAFATESTKHLANALREQLDAGVLPWNELLRENALTVACDALHYFAYWETPVSLPRRWTTRFFLAELPPGREACIDGRELLNSRWMSAAEVLSAGDEGGMTLPFPTRATLEKLAEFERLEDLMRWASAAASHGIDRILPVIRDEPGGERVVIPGDPKYPPDPAS
jgi:8-oxo-dGTP pyrophosphatase MutT (NUDIX family)